jgi:hypothetical protein
VEEEQAPGGAPPAGALLRFFTKNPGLADSRGAVIYRASGARYSIRKANLLERQLEPGRGEKS